MICRDCRIAADSNDPDRHCSDPFCACQHWPVGHCIPVKEEAGEPAGEETDDGE